MKTAEEFFREKIKELYPDQKHITLWKQEINCETAMMWAQEYSVLKAKHYVTEALKQVIEGTDYDRQSILNAYPLDQIK